MTALEIAQIYTDLVNLDDQTPENESTAKEEIGVLRSKYHQILMDKFQEEGIEFIDRIDATCKAFEIVKQHHRLIEDSHDLKVIAERRPEKTIPFESMKKKLRTT